MVDGALGRAFNRWRGALLPLASGQVISMASSNGPDLQPVTVFKNCSDAEFKLRRQLARIDERVETAELDSSLATSSDGDVGTSDADRGHMHDPVRLYEF